MEFNNDKLLDLCRMCSLCYKNNDALKVLMKDMRFLINAVPYP